MKKIIIVTFIAVITVIAGYNIYTSQTNENLSSLILANIEALADDTEYVIGTTGTNWKTYRIQCTRTVGVDFGLVFTKTVTYWTDGCGYGTGLCLSPAGC